MIEVIESALDVYANAANYSRNLDIPSRDVVEKLARAAMRIVAYEFDNNNPEKAMDTIHKAEAIESYLKKTIGRIKGDKITQNIMAAEVLRMKYRAGQYFDKYVAPNGVRKDYYDSSLYPQGEYVIYGDEIPERFGITPRVAYYWSQLSRSASSSDLENFFKPYLFSDNGEVDDLIFERLYRFAVPPKQKEPKPEPEVELSSAGLRLYNALRDLREVAIKYVEFILTNDVELREIKFLIGTMKDAASNLMGMVDEMES